MRIPEIIDDEVQSLSLKVELNFLDNMLSQARSYR